jgi:hypothetical protein
MQTRYSGAAWRRAQQPAGRPSPTKPRPSPATPGSLCGPGAELGLVARAGRRRTLQGVGTAPWTWLVSPERHPMAGGQNWEGNVRALGPAYDPSGAGDVTAVALVATGSVYTSPWRHPPGWVAGWWLGQVVRRFAAATRPGARRFGATRTTTAPGAPGIAVEANDKVAVADFAYTITFGGTTLAAPFSR